MLAMKCWFCNKEIPVPFKNKGIGICWRCGNEFKPNDYWTDPNLQKYCSKDCRYPLFCNDICKDSFKRLLNKWHRMLDYTKKERIKLSICKYGVPIIGAVLITLICLIFLF